MEDWVEKAHNLLINSGLVKSDIVAAVNSSFETGSIILRNNTVQMIELLTENKIPLGICCICITHLLTYSLVDELFHSYI